MKVRNNFVIKSTATDTAVEPQTKAARLAWLGGDKRPYVIAFTLGMVIGLVVLGWGLFPVQWTNVPYTLLGDAEKTILLDLANDLNAYNPQSPQVERLSKQWGEIDDLACTVAEQETDPARKVQLMALAFRINGKGCIDGVTE